MHGKYKERMHRYWWRRGWPRLRGFLAKMGVDAYPHQPHHHYVPDYYGRSAHKHLDIRTLPIFGELAQKVVADDRTLLYYDRLYTIYQAINRFILVHRPSQSLPSLAEVGVFRGGTTYFIASLIAYHHLEAMTQVHGFDTFQGHQPEDVISEKDPFHKPGLFSHTAYASVRAYLDVFPFVHLHQGRFQDRCDEVRNEQFFFVHLDVDLYEVTQAGLRFFDERLVSGGTIVVDDYGFYTCPGVKQAVDEFVATRSDYAFFHLLTGQAILVRL